jgi:hypothetical protein
MKKREQSEPLDSEAINEPGSIGEEQMPQGAGPKTDKHVWNYAADKAKGDDFLGSWFKKFIGRGGEH